MKGTPPGEATKWNPYEEVRPKINFEAFKPGVFYSWKARAWEYIRDKDPVKTYRTPDANKVPWTFVEAIKDPTGTFLGRESWTEDEVNYTLRNSDRYEVAQVIKNTSNYNSIGPRSELSGQGVGQMANDRNLEKEIMYSRMSWNPKALVEVKGEKPYDRRIRMDLNYILHKITLGHYRWDPKESLTMAPGHMGYGKGICSKEKPVQGPNIRGRYARDLRGDKDVLWEFTNDTDYSNTGSDNGLGHYSEKQSFIGLQNKFRGSKNVNL